MWEFVRNAVVIWLSIACLVGLAGLLYLHTLFGLIVLAGLIILGFTLSRLFRLSSECEFEEIGNRDGRRSNEEISSALHAKLGRDLAIALVIVIALAAAWLIYSQRMQSFE